MVSTQIDTDLDRNYVPTVPFQECNKIPIIVVKRHKEVACYIRQAVKKKILPAQDISIIHFDSHPDILGNVNIPADYAHRINNYDASYSKNWLLPMTYIGHFNKIAWFRPPHANDILKTGSYKWIAGKDVKTGFIRLNNKIDYCINQQMYRNKNDMTKTKKFSFDVVTIGNKLYEKQGFPGDDTKYIKLVLSRINKKPYILDINVDFFTCYDPYFSMYKEANMFDRITRIYWPCTPIYDNPVATDEEIYEFMEKRLRRLSELEYVMACFNCGSPIPEHIEGYDELMALKHDLDSLYPVDEIDWYLIHQAGLTVIGSELPHFIPSTDELQILYQVLEDVFDNLVDTPPALITIANYHKAVYTRYGAGIITNIIDVLQKKFKNLGEPHFTYKRRTSSEEDSESENDD